MLSTGRSLRSSFFFNSLCNGSENVTISFKGLSHNFVTKTGEKKKKIKFFLHVMVLKKRKTLWYLTYVIISIWKIFHLKYFLLPVWLLCRSQEIKQPNSNPFLLQSPNPFLAIVPICTKFCKFVKNVVLNVEAVVQRCSIKKVFLKISQNSQEKKPLFY